MLQFPWELWAQFDMITHSMTQLTEAWRNMWSPLRSTDPVKYTLIVISVTSTEVVLFVFIYVI